MEESVKLETCDPNTLIKSVEESIETLRSIEALEELKEEEQLNSLKEQSHFCEDDNETIAINVPPASVHTCYHCGSDYATKGDIRQHLSDGYCSGVRCDFCWRHFPSKKSVHCHILQNCLKLVSPVSDNFADVSVAKLTRCLKCNESFLLKDYQKHQRKFHRKKAECELCHRVFSCKKGLELHRSIHSGIRSFECEICKKQFRLQWYLRCHEKRHTLQNVIIAKKHCCGICGKHFSKPSDLRRHMSVHSEARVFSCHICDRAYKENNTLRRHVAAVHEKKRNFVCGICYKAFHQSSSLKKHLFVHSAGKPFSCEFCSKRYRNKSSLKIHMLTHEPHLNPMSFKCSTCCEIFQTKGNLKTHKLTHSGLRPFPCHVCGKSFRWKASRANHIAYSHSEIRSFKCETCWSLFKTKTILMGHIRRHFELKRF